MHGHKTMKTLSKSLQFWDALHMSIFDLLEASIWFGFGTWDLPFKKLQWSTYFQIGHFITGTKWGQQHLSKFKAVHPSKWLPFKGSHIVSYNIYISNYLWNVDELTYLFLICENLCSNFFFHETRSPLVCYLDLFDLPVCKRLQPFLRKSQWYLQLQGLPLSIHYLNLYLNPWPCAMPTTCWLHPKNFYTKIFLEANNIKGSYIEC